MQQIVFFSYLAAYDPAWEAVISSEEMEGHFTQSKLAPRVRRMVPANMIWQSCECNLEATHKVQGSVPHVTLSHQEREN